MLSNDISLLMFSLEAFIVNILFMLFCTRMIHLVLQMKTDVCWELVLRGLTSAAVWSVHQRHPELREVAVRYLTQTPPVMETVMLSFPSHCLFPSSQFPLEEVQESQRQDGAEGVGHSPTYSSLCSSSESLKVQKTSEAESLQS